MLDKNNSHRILAIEDFYNNIKFHSWELDHFIIFLAESTVVWPSKRLQFFADVVEMSSHAYIVRSCETLGVLHNIQRIPYKMRNACLFRLQSPVGLSIDLLNKAKFRLPND